MKRDLTFRLRLAAIGAGLAAVILFQVLAAFPALVESLYASGPGRFLPWALSRLTGWIPFSVGEILLALFVLRQLHGAWRGAARIRRGEWSWRKGLAAGALRFGADAGLVVALAYLFWGFHYAREPLEVRHGWQGSDAPLEELTRLAGEMVDNANADYVALHGSEDRGSPTTRLLERRQLAASIEAGYAEIARSLGEPATATGFGAPKSSMGGRALDYLGVSGFYFPWTGEAHYNGGAPPVGHPQTVAHEMAHQRGYAREDEANFVGFLAAALAPDTWPRYSAHVFAHRQLIRAIAIHDPEVAMDLIKRRLPGVQRDIDASNAYWARFAGPARRAAATVNDTYLRTHRVPGGILSYGRSVELLVAWARSREEGAVP